MQSLETNEKATHAGSRRRPPIHAGDTMQRPPALLGALLCRAWAAASRLDHLHVNYMRAGLVASFAILGGLAASLHGCASLPYSLLCGSGVGMLYTFAVSVLGEWLAGRDDVTGLHREQIRKAGFPLEHSLAPPTMLAACQRGDAATLKAILHTFPVPFRAKCWATLIGCSFGTVKSPGVHRHAWLVPMPPASCPTLPFAVHERGRKVGKIGRGSKEIASHESRSRQGMHAPRERTATHRDAPRRGHAR